MGIHEVSKSDLITHLLNVKKFDSFVRSFTSCISSPITDGDPFFTTGSRSHVSVR